MVYILSLIIASLLAIASTLGLLFGPTIYPTDELYNNFISNDIVNLIIGLPIILASILLTSRGKLIGLLFWPGTLLFVIYNYLIYTLAIPTDWTFPLYLTLIAPSAYTIILLAKSIDGTKIQQQLTDQVHETISGTILIAMGLLFMLQAGGAMIDASINQLQLTQIDIAVHITDLSISPALIIGGLQLFRHKKLGYTSGLGLLFQASMLFIGLIAFLIIQPLLTKTPLLLADILVVSIMGLVCFIPLILFIRAAQTTQKPKD